MKKTWKNTNVKVLWFTKYCAIQGMYLGPGGQKTKRQKIFENAKKGKRWGGPEKNLSAKEKQEGGTKRSIEHNTGLQGSKTRRGVAVEVLGGGGEKPRLSKKKEDAGR